MRVFVALVTAAGHAVRIVRKYGLAYASAALVATGAAELAHSVPVGLVLAGVFGLVDDHRRSV